MKVLVISHSCVTDVNQQQFVALQQIPEIEVCLIVPARWRSEYTGKPQIPALLPSVNFPVLLLPIMLPGQVSLHFYTHLAVRRLKRFHPDVILSTQEPWSLSGLQAVLLARLLQVPLVFQTNQNILKRYPFPFSWIERASYQTAAIALAYSEEARQVMLKKGLKRPSQVVPYGTDLSLFQSRPGSPLRHKLKLTDKVVLGYMGRLVPEKGLNTLILAVKSILSQKPDFPLTILIVGTGSEELALKQQAQKLEIDSHFIFAGAVPHNQAGEYMNCMDIFVLPSLTMPNWKEQFGRVIIEAMACGVPVVGSDSGQIPILINETGGGLVFKEDHAEDLAAKLSRLLDDSEERVQLGKTGQEAVRASYTYEAVAQQLHGILREAVEAKSSRAVAAL